MKPPRVPGVKVVFFKGRPVAMKDFQARDLLGGRMSRKDGHTFGSLAGAWPARDRVLHYLHTHPDEVVKKKVLKRETHVTDSEFQNVLTALSYQDKRLSEDDQGHLLYSSNQLRNQGDL
jgi:hypothetical protein